MLTNDLKRIYTSHAETRMYYDTIQLYHPNFEGSQDYVYPRNNSYPDDLSYPADVNTDEGSHFLVRNTENMLLNLEEDANEVLFRSYPFNIVQPEVGSEQQDMALVLDNVSLELISELEKAIELPDTPIKMTYRVYIEGNQNPQITPIDLDLSNIVVDMESISCTATRANLYERRFPYGASTIYDSRFIGLFL